MFNQIKKLVFLTIFCGLFFIAAGSVHAEGCNPEANQIALFRNLNFGGDCKVFDIGEYAFVEDEGFPNDVASSVKVGEGVKVILFEHRDFDGKSQTFEEDTASLIDSEVGNDVISSLKVIAKE